MQCEEKNRSLHGGPSAQEKAYKIRCALPVKKAMKIGKAEEVKCKEISKNKQNTSQNSEGYLELKDDRKIQVLNGACLKGC